MTWWAAPLLALASLQAMAATAYVSDELTLGVYAQPNDQSARLATLRSGASVETLEVGGDYTQVRLADGTTGWLKSAYLAAEAPAIVRIKALQAELDRMHATTPALAEAAARNEMQHLQRELAAARARGARDFHPLTVRADGWWLTAAAAVAGLAAGVVIGHAALARRVRQKFGGLKVY